MPKEKQKLSESQNACTTYDFTANGGDISDCINLLNTHCKKWDFQQEKGEQNGTVHLQGRFHLNKKQRKTGVVKLFPGFHVSITSTENINNCYYVTKAETRIAGPWSSDGPCNYIPRQVAEITTLYPWQQQIIDDAKIWDTRSINMIVDPTGNIGKTTICRYIDCHGIGKKIPYCDNYKDVMRMVMDLPTSKLYIFDLPRAIDKQNLAGMISGIEEVKGGYAFDDRYKFRTKHFDCPNIWVFSNHYPNCSNLSADRWKIWNVVDGNLVRYINPYSDPKTQDTGSFREAVKHDA